MRQYKPKLERASYPGWWAPNAPATVVTPKAAPPAPTVKICKAVNRPCTHIGCADLTACMGDCGWSKEFVGQMLNSPQCANVPLKPVSPSDIQYAVGQGQQGAQNIATGAQQTAGAIGKTAGDIGSQLTASANALGQMSKTLQDTFNWLFQGCTFGKYHTPTPCWFNGAVIIMVLWIISKVV